MSFNFGGTGGAGDKKPTFTFGAASTPAAGGPTNVFGNQASTTPAGPPPSNTGFNFGGGQSSNTASSGLFGGGNEGKGGSGGFGGTSTTPAATPAPASFSFGSKLAADSGAASNTVTPAASGTSTPSGGFASGAVAQDNTTNPTSGFSLAATTTTTTTDKPADKPTFSFGSSVQKPAESKAPETKTTFNFGGSATPAANEKPAEKQGGFSFGTPAVLSSENKPADKSTGFSGFGAPTESAKTDKPAEKTGGFGFALDSSKSEKGADKPAASGFGFGAPAAPASGNSKATNDTKPSFGFGGATQTTSDSKAPAAPAPAILKNKTLDELVTKWSQDLEKYANAFQKQARQIANWDQTLLSSGDAISRLYAATATAEQTSGKVDQALTYIEHQQDELEAMLDVYEAQVKEISNEVGVSQPVDLEREKAYGQAEKLITELDGLGKDLGGMMTDINKSAETMSQLKESDALSTIVKTLNQHVESLSWIDENAALLSDKLNGLQVLEAEKSRLPTQRSTFGSMRLS
ncbi:Nsp1-like C-terminal region-domain-containing protein [Protomyces lactucae-debilis]|uniref:Nucleoporin NSP1 n=1 Tax=Protomyces lactucae-debilis TaxID=2754530 RepID=A0A1Y2FBM1_PROLT|nr:Nsp1-like C-terminal region-domain-containing protein [Protomyces lactucae-debilis]ORY81017.1 Nsp1-like C-terminal region-domain-containing protein [Protomyces lactucae-debilis]